MWTKEKQKTKAILERVNALHQSDIEPERDDIVEISDRAVDYIVYSSLLDSENAEKIFRGLKGERSCTLTCFRR